MMKLQPFKPHLSKEPIIRQLKEGFIFVIRHPVIRILMLMVICTSFVGHAYITLLPEWAVNVLGGDSAVNGYLQSARGLGAFLAALMIGALVRIKFKGKILTIGSFTFPLMVLVWAVMRTIPLSLFLSPYADGVSLLILNMTQTLTQVSVLDHLRGRVMGIYTFAFFGMMSLGALLGGSLAEWISELAAVSILSLACLFFAFWVYLKFPAIRAIE